MSRPIPEGVDFIPTTTCYCDIPCGMALAAGICDSDPNGDRDSEVARLNTNPNEISSSLVDPKDALIREMVERLRKEEKSFREEGDGYDDLSTAQGMATVLDELEAILARTNCPEAFGGCNETSPS